MQEYDNEHLCWMNLATTVAGLIKSNVAESQHSDTCKSYKLLIKNGATKIRQTTKHKIS